MKKKKKESAKKEYSRGMEILTAYIFGIVAGVVLAVAMFYLMAIKYRVI